MSRWFRFYDAALDDPKVQRLPDAVFRAWVNLLCIASRNDGKIPKNLEDLKFSLRKSEGKTREILEVLISSGLIDAGENGLEPHNWAARQYKSDVSTDRVKRYRERCETVSETPPEQNRTEHKESNTSDLQSDQCKPEPKPVSRKTSYPEPFDDFWREYPTDELMSKKAAFAQWKRLDQPSQDAARAAIPAFKDYCRKNTTYRPVHAQRFLSDRRFDGFEATKLDPESIAAAKDKADRLLKRGAYAERYDA